MSISRIEMDTNPFEPKQISPGLYKSESYSEDGEKIDLYMELFTVDNIGLWNTYRKKAVLIADELITVTSLDSSKRSALAEVYRGAYAKEFLKNEYVLYAVKHGAQPPFLTSTISEESYSIEEFQRDYGNLLMSVVADFQVRKTLFGMLHEYSYENRGIFRNPLSIVENTHKGLAMLLHGFSAAVSTKFFPEKLYLEVSPIGSMQYILFHSLPREAFFNNEEDYNKIREAASMRSGPEVVNNIIKTDRLARLYFDRSIENESRANPSSEFKI